MKRGFTLVELLVVIVIISVLAGLLIPAIVAALREARITDCMNNLRNIGQLTEVYRKSCSAHYGLPDATGARFHQALIDRGLAGRSAAIFQCPLEGLPTTVPDFRGPARNVNVERNYEMEDAIAGDKVDASGQTNHGDPERYGVNALTKAHSVIRITSSDTARWNQFMNGTMD
jgi:prepilin-type N-terminal cleavage/methylation domain-containing protein